MVVRNKFVPERDVPLGLDESWLFVLIPALLYYATAILVILPKTDTFAWRLSLWPLTLLSTFWASAAVDAKPVPDDARYSFMNQGLTVRCSVIPQDALLTSMKLVMFVAAMRSTVWTFATETPLTRRRFPEIPTSSGWKQIALDAVDLGLGLRGIHWSFSKGLRLPPETRPTSSKSAFIRPTLLSIILHLFLVDYCHYMAQCFSPPATRVSPTGGTLFDESLPPFPRYFYAYVVTFHAGVVVYSSMTAAYDIMAVVAITLLGHHPIQWPPLYNAPWRGTSLATVWSKHWHQIFRDSFIGLGYTPFSAIFGRPGGVIGVFLISGLLHSVGLWAHGQGLEFLGTTGFFVAMSIGTLLEGVWRQVTGKCVGGWAGWIWTMSWGFGWGIVIVQAWSQKGLIASLFFPEAFRPGKLFVDGVVHLLELSH